jgi:hypothetical protein
MTATEGHAAMSPDDRPEADIGGIRIIEVFFS